MIEEPKTDAEIEEELERLGVKVIDVGDWFVAQTESGRMKLEAEAGDLSSALEEAWALYRP